VAVIRPRHRQFLQRSQCRPVRHQLISSNFQCARSGTYCVALTLDSMKYFRFGGESRVCPYSALLYRIPKIGGYFTYLRKSGWRQIQTVWYSHFVRLSRIVQNESMQRVETSAKANQVHMGFWLVPKSVTLNDLERRVGSYSALFYWIRQIGGQFQRIRDFCDDALCKSTFTIPLPYHLRISGWR